MKPFLLLLILIWSAVFLHGDNYYQNDNGVWWKFENVRNKIIFVNTDGWLM